MPTEDERNRDLLDYRLEIAKTYQSLISLSNQNWARLVMFRGVAQAGLNYGGFAMAREVAEKIVDNERKLFGTSSAPYTPAAHRADFLDNLLKMDQDQVSRATDGAAVVFAHSILDYEVTQFCELCLLARVDHAEEILAKKKVELHEVRTTPYPVLLSNAIKARVRELADESLIKRIHFMFGECSIDPSKTTFAGFTPDLDRVGRFDALRNDIAHRAAFEKLPRPLDSELDFIQNMGLYLAARFRENNEDVFRYASAGEKGAGA